MTADQPPDGGGDTSDQQTVGDNSDSDSESVDSTIDSDDSADDDSTADSGTIAGDDTAASNDTTTANNTPASNDTAADTDGTETSTLDIGSVAADDIEDIEDDEPRYEQSLPGVVIHPLAFLGLVGLGALPAAGLYLAARTPFTRANARNALNWHLSVLTLGVVTVLALGVGRTEGIITGELIDWQLLPGPVATLVGLVGLLLVIVWMAAWLLTVVFAVVATFNAAASYTWRYPFAPDIVGWLGERV
ncbi:MAG: hypothetical protein J07HN6_02063 [Halonotius sp. J07HN6]|nr:MAG: hypothetical protein J07HN6_02063 [Halonotius sp. J07HN6]